MFTVDTLRFREALHQKGYGSISQLAQALGMHRNTIHHYLAGRGIFPENFEKVMMALGLGPAEILTFKRDTAQAPWAPIAFFVDQLHAKFPQATFVLFGSRASGKAKTYSDWDIGVFSHEGLAHTVYRKIVASAQDIAEDSAYLIQLMNLNHADSSFLQEISRHWVFLAGRQQDWLDLQRRIA